MLLLLAILFVTTSAHNLTCHCSNSDKCHSNGYCEFGCANGWFGPGCQIGNVALGKTANQSSTYVGYVGNRHDAGLAVDGQMSAFSTRHCSHTMPLRSAGSAWWSVVLDSTQYFVITNITIVNRVSDPNKTERRLTNFKILYSNETERNPDPSDSIWHECVKEIGTISGQKTYICKNTAIAKKVAVYLTTEPINNPNTILTLCEVYIYGYQLYVCPSGYTGPGCLLRTCDQCDLNIGRCSEDSGRCSYNVCPHRSLLPPECWISLRSSSPATENDVHVLAGSIGGSMAVIVVIAAIVAFVYYRRKRSSESPALVTSQDTESHLPASTLDVKPLPSCKEQSEGTYETLNIDLGKQTAGDYACLKYST